MKEELVQHIDTKIVESLVLQGDISKMDSKQKVDYYNWLCNTLGLNPATQPFQIIKFQGKETLYAKKDATEQLRKIHGVAVIDIVTDNSIEGIVVVKAKVQDKTGRTDFGTGAVAIANLKGEALCNAYMKAETKAKRRATLSVCGLGMLDESELDTMPTYTTEPIVKPKEVAIEPQDEKLCLELEMRLSAFTDANELKEKGKPIIEEFKEKGLKENYIKAELNKKYKGLVK